MLRCGVAMNSTDGAPKGSAPKLGWWLRVLAAAVVVFGVIHVAPRAEAALNEFNAAKALNSRVAQLFPDLAQPGTIQDLLFGNDSVDRMVVFASYSCDLCRPFWQYLTVAERLRVLPATRLHFLLDPTAVELDSIAVDALICAASTGEFRVVHRWLVDRDVWTRPGQLARTPVLVREGCDPGTAQRLIAHDRELARQLGFTDPPVVLTRTRAYQGVDAVEFIRALGSEQ